MWKIAKEERTFSNQNKIYDVCFKKNMVKRRWVIHLYTRFACSLMCAVKLDLFIFLQEKIKENSSGTQPTPISNNGNKNGETNKQTQWALKWKRYQHNLIYDRVYGDLHVLYRAELEKIMVSFWHIKTNVNVKFTQKSIFIHKLLTFEH